MAEQPTDIGMNRTGLDTSPKQSSAMMENAKLANVQPGDKSRLAQNRRKHYAEAGPIGSVPPPASAKGVVKTAMDVIKGEKPNVLLDKMGERLAFERTGVRLYDAILTKFEDSPKWNEGPTREKLEHIRREEHEHFLMLKEKIESLGADPTAMTPAADVSAVASEGVLKVITDPRTTLPQSLEAVLIAERADADGWDALISLADSAGHSKIVKEFQDARDDEEEHIDWVKGWVTSATKHDLMRDLGH